MDTRNPLLDVDPGTLSRLNGGGLTRVLRELVWLELNRNGIPQSDAQVPLNIKVRDGGIDGRVRWEGEPDPVQLDGLSSRDTAFQSKATPMGPIACKNELLNPDGDRLKTKVGEALGEGACYVLVNSEQLNPDQIDKRVEKMREAVRESEDEIDLESATFEVLDATKIVNWARKYPSAITLIRDLTALPSPTGFVRWKVWTTEGANKPGFTAKLVVTDDVDRNIEWIRSRLSEGGTVSRLVGLSGLGKTRMALEALRMPEDTEAAPEQAALNRLTLYVEPKNIGIPRLVRTVRKLVQTGRQAIVVVDDCKFQLHDKLGAIVNREGSNIRLLTLHHETEKGKGLGERRKITPESQKPVVQKMLADSPEANDLSEADADRIEQFAQGFPLAAEKLLEVWSEGGIGGDTLTNPELVRKMLFGSEEKPEKRHLIRCCALFAFFGVKDEVKHQLTFIAEEIAGVSRNRLHRLCNELERRGIMQQQGRYMHVRPLPLALRLAAEWWETVPRDQAQNLVENAGQAGLVDSLCKHLERLDEVENAREIAGALCEEGNSFTRAGVLRTSVGGRIFRALSVLNPPAAANALEHAFGEKTTEELLEVEDGRRQLVRALEHLAFQKETFHSAARMLLYFAAAENERWSNNATGRFQQLFHIYLSGTQTPAIERVSILEEGLRSEDPERRKMAIEGLDSALKTRHFMRSVGEERKGMGGGSGPEDWTPDQNEEVFEYWRACLELLGEKATEEGQEGELVREKLGEKAGILLTILGVSNEAEQAVRDVANHVDGAWLEGLEAVEKALETDPDQMPEGLKNRLQQLRQDLLPTDLGERLRYVVTSPPQSVRFRRTEEDEYTDLGRKRARDLARELTETGPPDWKEVTEVLCVGRQQYAREFGSEVAKMPDDPSPVVDAALDVLSNLSEDQGRHWGLIAGVLAESSSEWRNEVLDSIFHSDELRSGYWRILQSIGVETEDLDRLADAVEEGLIEERELAELRFAFSRVQPEHLAEFAKRVLKADDQYGPAILEIIQTYEHRREGQREALQDIQREVALENLSASALKQQSWQRSYTWRETLVPLLRDREDEELARAVTEQIIELAESASPASSIGPELEEVVEVLFDEYLAEVWPMFGEAMLSGSMKSMTVMEIVAKNPLVSSSEVGPGGPLFRCIDEEFLIEWCEENTPEAPALLGQTGPIFRAKSESESESRPGMWEEPKVAEWYPFALRLIDEFGDLDEVRSSISSNMFGFGSSGSRIPYYERRITLLEELLEHDILEVRQWASEEISRYESTIERERQEEQERDLRLSS